MFNILKVNGKFKFIPFVISILIPLGGSGVIYYLTRNALMNYGQLQKPVFAPPAIVFMIVWPILYVLMGIASYRIYMLRDQGKNIGSALFYYTIQLLLNFLWSFIFFSFRLYGLAFIELVILLVFVIVTFMKFVKIDKIAGFLLIPYMLWLGFAAALNYFVWWLNEA